MTSKGVEIPGEAVASAHYRFEDHEGFKIVVVDYREDDRATLLERVRVVKDYILGQPLRSVLQLTYLHDDPYPTVWMQTITDAVREQKPYMRASAVVGLRKLKPILNAVNRIAGRKIRVFDDKESAIRWLLGEAGVGS